MSAYLVGQIAVHNEALWQEYVTGVARSLEPFDYWASVWNTDVEIGG